MRIIADPAELVERPCGPLILVPTMGALHEGHLELIRRARDEAGSDATLAVSIFVNPIQFNQSDDLAAYPRTLDEDLEKCRSEGVDLVFTPDVDDLLPPDRSVTVLETSLSKTLCGATRPGHFDGVCTIVLKFFNLFRPDAAVFGEKDYQQLAIIRRMVRDLDVPVEIIGHPTVREPDGLAMSSRNTRLSPEQRADAPRIRQALVAAESTCPSKPRRSGIRQANPSIPPADLLTQVRCAIESPLNRIDYLQLVDAESLQPVADFSQPTLLATAVFYGEVRLIDNIVIQPR